MLRRALAVPNRRVRLGAAVAVLCVLASAADTAADDRVPTAWMEQAGTAPLLQAPPPPSPVSICVIDTGVTATPDLDISARESLLGGTPDDIQAWPGRPGHGTVVAHFAAGRVNGWGGAGVFPHARIVSVRIFPAAGEARWQHYVQAIDHCSMLSSEAKVAILSLGGQAIQDGERRELENRIISARDSLQLNVVAAAGNGGGSTDFPGRFPAAFTVAALDSGGGLCGFSARGDGVDIAAPGCGAAQAGWDGSSWLMDGTSYAAPIVAGTLAAIRAFRPDLTASDAEKILLETARPGPFPTVDAGAALEAIGRGDVVDAYRPVEKPANPSPLDARIPHPGALAGPAGEWSGPVSAGWERAAQSPSSGKAPIPAPRLRAGWVRHGRVRVRAVGRPRGALLELRAGAHRTIREASQIRFVVGRERFMRGRYRTAFGHSRWTRLTIRRR